MSEQNENRNNRSRNNNSGGNNSNGGNRNRNRNRNRSGGQGGQGGGGGNRNRNQNNRSSGGGGGNAGQKRDQLQPSRSRRPRKKPLTFWQKIFKAIGLYKEADAPAKGDKQGAAPAQKTAKKQGRQPGGGRTNQDQSNRGGQGGQGAQEGQKQRQRKKTPPPTKVETPRLYVGNLSYDATEYDLEELFKGVGAVRKVELVYNRHTHKSKGYGFINMANMEEAERAVEVLHDQPFMGRKMIVNGARSKGPNDKTPGGDDDSTPVAEEPKQEEKPAAPKDDIPAEEEVHSLAPEQNQ